MSCKRKYIKKNKDYYFIFKSKSKSKENRPLNCCVSFQPQKIKNNKYGKSITPTFNNDKLYYTPVFQLPRDKDGEENIDYLKEFGEKMHDALFKVSQLQFPQPKRLKVYCKVCNCSIVDYKKHIQSPSHILSTQYCSYSKKIQQLCKQFQKDVLSKKQSSEISVSNKSTQNHYFRSSKRKYCIKEYK